MGRFVDVIPGEGEEGRHVPQDVRGVVRVHVLENADFAQNILPYGGADTNHRGRAKWWRVTRGERGWGGVTSLFDVDR